MKQVSKDQFFSAIYKGKLNVHPSIRGNFPYTSVWMFLNNPRGAPFGKSVDRVEGGVIKTDYFINDEHSPERTAA